jgi:hypothetical protein
LRAAGQAVFEMGSFLKHCAAAPSCP